MFFVWDFLSPTIGIREVIENPPMFLLARLFFFCCLETRGYRWSCREAILDQNHGQCELKFDFEHAQHLQVMEVYFHKWDERYRSLKVTKLSLPSLSSWCFLSVYVTCQAGVGGVQRLSGVGFKYPECQRLWQGCLQ